MTDRKRKDWEQGDWMQWAQLEARILHAMSGKRAFYQTGHSPTGRIHRINRNLPVW